MRDFDSESKDLLKQFLANYSEAVARYNAAVVEMKRLQGRVPEKEYAGLNAVVAEAREEASRTRAVLRSFRERSSPPHSNGIAIAPNGNAKGPGMALK